MRHKVWLFIVLMLFLASFPVLMAQELAATLNGTVTDPTGAVIPRAAVTIAGVGVNGVPRTVQTNAQGKAGLVQAEHLVNPTMDYRNLYC